MKAVAISGSTPAEEVSISEVPLPETGPGWLRIKITAFGMNHSEQILRLSEIEQDYI